MTETARAAGPRPRGPHAGRAAPRITIVIPVSGVQDQIRACLDSILTQPFRDIEVIAVDDCSPDGRGDLLDEYARGDMRVQVIHLEGAVFTLRDRPEVLRLTMTSWSKPIRRTFLTDLGLRFEPGIHEDVTFTCEILMNASRIATLDRVCYLNRQGRTGALTSKPSRDNFQIFTRYEKVFDTIVSRSAEFGFLWPVIFDRAIWHYTTVLASRRSVPRRARREFFRRIREHFTRFRPERHSYPAGSAGSARSARLHAVKYMLVERGAYRTYRALQLAHKARIMVRGGSPRPARCFDLFDKT
jgi:glycosyltransferase involved in cell wall biosynthesis